MSTSQREVASAATRSRKGFWERWTTRFGTVVLLVGVLAGGVYANVESVPSHSPWQDKLSNVLRHMGLGDES